MSKKLTEKSLEKKLHNMDTGEQKMSSDIKNEFEEYVKTLTETICNDIFLEKLEQICHEYEDGVKPVQQKS